MEQENATQQGADSVQFAPAHAARSAALAQIAQSVNADYAPDMQGFDEETGVIHPAAKPAETAADAVQEQTNEQPVEVAEETQDDLETIVVDGKEVQVKRAQLLDAGRRTLQKESAADKRLQEATEIHNRAKALEQSLMQRQPSSDAGSQQQSPSSDATNGTGETQATSRPVDVQALVRQELWLDRAETAASRFKDEFKDLVEDPFAARLVAQLENERLNLAAAEGRPFGDPWEAYKSHGEKVREWLGKVKPKEAAQVSADKTERKRETVTVTGSGARLQTRETPKQLTAAEQVEKMRQQRLSGRQLPTTSR